MKKILLVEDEKTLINIYKLALTQAGYNLVIIERPDEAHETALKEKPDLILLDMVFYKPDGQLSKEPGFQALEKLQARPGTKGIPIIAFTNLSAEDSDKAIQMGAKAYITKAEAVPREVIKEIERWIK